MKYKMDFLELRYWLFIRMRVGIYNMMKSKNKKIIFGILLSILIGIFFARDAIWNFSDSYILNMLGFASAYFLLCFFTICGSLLLFGNIFQALKIHRGLMRLGMYNHLHEAPTFLYKETFDDIFFTFYFESVGISIEEWKKRKYALENIFNASISKIELGKDMNHIIIHGMSGKRDFSSIHVWDINSKTRGDAVLSAGHGMHGFVDISLKVYPHILIGGSTGSGKTFLLKALLFQAIQMNYDVIISDFKGGVDFNKEWKERCTFIEDIPSLIIQLHKILIELELRKKLLLEAECENIDELNQLDEFNIKRIIFACDEIAELFDTAGMDKEQKEQKKKIEGMIATIARLGRAFGIHLLLSTQRPDADVISGQIKNNIPYRICGRADSILSKIILDNTEAAELIPDDIPGVFMNQNGEMFKSYLLYDKFRGEAM